MFRFMEGGRKKGWQDMIRAVNVSKQNHNAWGTKKPSGTRRGIAPTRQPEGKSKGFPPH